MLVGRMADNLTQNQLNDEKVVLIGHVGVGKSTLFLRFKDGEFVEDADRQVNIASSAEHTKILKNGLKVSRCTTVLCLCVDCFLFVQLTLLDTAGMEKHLTTLPPTYFREAKAIIYVFAVNDQESFECLHQWTENAEMSAPFGCTRAVVGNKIDVPERCVDETPVKQWAQNHDIPEDMVFFVSAKEGDGVDDLFMKIAQEMAPAPQRNPAPKKDSDCCLKK